MSNAKRSLSVTIISCIYILTGTLGLAFHLRESALRHEWGYGIMLISLLEIVAIIAGTYMLRGANWARWLALVWMAFHVVISFWEGWSKVAAHAAFLLIIGYFLLRRQANEYFSPAKPLS